MPYYYLNKKPHPDGNYEIHKLNCAHGAKPENRLDLDWHLSSYAALDAAKQMFPDKAAHIRGCFYCCNEARDDN